MKCRKALSALCCAALVAVATGQDVPGGTPALRYSSVSIRKINRSNAPFFGCDSEPARLRCFGSPVGLVHIAYNLHEGKLLEGSPAWADNDVYALVAALDEADVGRAAKLSADQRGALLILVLADRFGLTAHWEQKPTPVYDVEVAKGGPKLLAPAAASDSDLAGMPSTMARTGLFIIMRGVARGYSEPIGTIIQQIPGVFGPQGFGRPLLDKTGLKGTCNFVLDPQPKGIQAGDVSGTHEDEASPFTLVEEQLGLKLVPAKEPMQVLHVDAIHPPTEN